VHPTAPLAAALRDRVLAGRNGDGELGDGTRTNQYVPTPVSSINVSTWRAISAGSQHTCGLAAGSGQDGKAYCWGESPPAPATNPPRLHVHARHPPLLVETASTQAQMVAAGWVPATTMTRTYPHRCPAPLYPAGS
jgi:hypothetical protein